MPHTDASGPGPGKTPATGTVTPDPARQCEYRGLHRVTVPFTRGVCLGCWFQWHFGR